MEPDHVRTESILDVLAQKGQCELDELVLLCPRFGWHQIFLEVDRLSREGLVRLVAKGCGIYVVGLASSVETMSGDRTSFLIRGEERRFSKDHIESGVPIAG